MLFLLMKFRPYNDLIHLTIGPAIGPTLRLLILLILAWRVRSARSTLLGSCRGAPVPPSNLHKHGRLEVRDRGVVRLAHSPQMTASLATFSPLGVRLVKWLVLRILVMVIKLA